MQSPSVSVALQEQEPVPSSLSRLPFEILHSPWPADPVEALAGQSLSPPYSEVQLADPPPQLPEIETSPRLAEADTVKTPGPPQSKMQVLGPSALTEQLVGPAASAVGARLAREVSMRLAATRSLTVLNRRSSRLAWPPVLEGVKTLFGYAERQWPMIEFNTFPQRLPCSRPWNHFGTRVFGRSYAVAKSTSKPASSSSSRMNVMRGPLSVVGGRV